MLDKRLIFCIEPIETMCLKIESYIYWEVLGVYKLKKPKNIICLL